MRRILYITGTRADFGLMQSTLDKINAADNLELGIAVTGMHLCKQYGNTIVDIEKSGLPIVNRFAVNLGSDKPSIMAKSIADELNGVVDTIENFKPDILLLLGDRGEMLAAAIAGLHLGIHIVHIHGGELSGTVDEPVRHAISKLSHFHFASTQGARQRLIKMGEKSDNVYVTGAPGLDDVVNISFSTRDEFLLQNGFDPNQKCALVIFHPVVQELDDIERQTLQLAEAVASIDDLQILFLMPNSDIGGESIRMVLNGFSGSFRLVEHLSRETYLQWLKHSDVMIGNSSSGILEAASFDTPVINIGDRQFGRERSANITDVSVDFEVIRHSTIKQLQTSKTPVDNIYGDGFAGEKIVELLQNISLDKHILKKINAY
ncbi:UDP-N-acetylglucosamine 2-epimerase [Aliamphritea hakodatensis]|uniref:UDP-N-acetylglucosamine 2-epimerase n=1 Tax=Aliamphritea hakodatensis TaxID=2895352 RepID=UPI0022FD5EB9|nr:UDP-N-acetylglucosamine 2-epimerase [Aliamphritea hakodatensis]